MPIPCSCGAYLSSTAWSEHYSQLHSQFSSQRNCRDCRFSSTSLACILGHFLLEGHALRLASHEKQVLLQSDVRSSLEASVTRDFELANSDKLTVANFAGTEKATLTECSEMGEESGSQEDATPLPVPIPEKVELNAPKAARNFKKASRAVRNSALTSKNTAESKQTQHDVFTTFKCAKCGKILQRMSLATVPHSKMNHAAGCLGLKLFACSRYGRHFARKDDANTHSGRRCQGAAVTEVDKEQTEAAMKKAVEQCFPS